MQVAEFKYDVLLALGSNLGDRLGALNSALKALSKHCTILQTSHLYETPPAYVTDQPAFLNAACAVQTTLDMQQLLKFIKEVEAEGKRVPTIRYGPRSIDVDIILARRVGLKTDIIIDTTNLTIPHKLMQERSFVLGPLCDIDPQRVHPLLGKTVTALFESLLAGRPTEAVGLQRVTPMSPKPNAPLWPHTSSHPSRVMAIINITPDSFSDGNAAALSPRDAVSRAQALARDGAQVLDLGAQSTRPGATVLTARDEANRLLPVLKAVRKALPEVLISVDTFYAEVAVAALDAGADLINDIMGGRHDDGRMLSVCASRGCPLVLMHSRGTPSTLHDPALQQYPANDVSGQVAKELLERVRTAEARGMPKWLLWLDPGIGFAKTPEQNLALLSNPRPLISLGFPIVLGVSRKGVLAQLLAKRRPAAQQVPPAERDWATTAVSVLGARWAALHRVHQARISDALLVAHAIAHPQDAFPRASL